MNRTLRRRVAAATLVAGCSLAITVTANGAYAADAAPSPHAQTTAVPPDYQGYVADTPVDPYNGDPSSIHVAVGGGSEVARSFVHFALNYLPPGARPTAMTATFTLTQQSGASSSSVYQVYNVDTSAAIVQACVLLAPIPATLTSANAPRYDCADGSSVGKPDAAGTAWTFDLRDLLPYWRSHGNDGLALVPVAGSAADTWSVSFYVSETAARVTYLPAAPAALSPTTPVPAPAALPASQPAAPSSVPPPPAAALSTAIGAPLPRAVTGTPVAPAGSAPALAPRGAAAPAAGPAAGPAPGTSNALWPWMLAGSLLVAAGALGVAHRGAVAGAMRRLGPPSVAAFRAHPRAYAIASVAAVWGLVCAGYSLDQATPATSLAAGSNAAAGATTAGTGVAGAPATAGPTAAPAVSPGAAGTATTAGAGAPRSAATEAAARSAPSAEQTAVASEFTGAGTWRTIDGVQVFFPASGGPPVAKYYSGSADTIGITPQQITLCAHAALTYGPAFNISASDLNVFWDWKNAHGGIFGRTVSFSYQNDNYDPGQAVQAAQACKDLGTFILLGGIGFDQIPAVRAWAEQNHELYLHHVATVAGSAGLRYSFTEMPTVEQFGTWFGQLDVAKFAGKKVGIIYRESPNWEPLVNNFVSVVKAAGIDVVGEEPVQINQGNYTQELATLHSEGAQVILVDENALATVEIIKQAQEQQYFPGWLVFPFNLEIRTLGAASLSQPIYGVASWDPYDANWDAGPYSSYASDIAEFNAEYKQYDPNAQLNGDGGDLLFLNWEADRQLADLLTACGPQCTRNRIAGILLAGYHANVPPACPVDFSGGDHHHGGNLIDAVQVVRDPTGQPAFVPINRCVRTVG